MDGQRERSGVDVRTLPSTNVRVLHGEVELAEAVERAAAGAKRLHDRLAARAAHDTWMREHTEQRVGWLRFAQGPTNRPQRQVGLGAHAGSRSSARAGQSATSSPAA